MSRSIRMFPADFPDCRGKSYRPSNGTEGWIFEENWCCQCGTNESIRDVQCDININALFGEQPKEWVYDENNNPSCAAWTERSVEQKAAIWAIKSQIGQARLSQQIKQIHRGAA